MGFSACYGQYDVAPFLRVRTRMHAILIGEGKYATFSSILIVPVS